MSRSGYSDDLEQSSLAMWRGRVASSIRGKRGQAFFAAMATALDAMPEKSLIAHDLVKDGAHCALGVLGAARGLPIETIEPEDADAVGAAFNIASCLAREVVYMNDEAGTWRGDETPEARWVRMRSWVAKQIKAPTPPTTE